MLSAVSELSRALRDAKLDRSIDDIVATAAKRGHEIDRSVVSRYLAGEHAKRPREATLAALAAGFGLDVRVLRHLAGKPAGELGPYTPTDESASLTRDQRDALDVLIKAIVRGGTQDGRRPEDQKTTPDAAASVTVLPAPESYADGQQLRAARRSTKASKDRPETPEY